MLPRGVVLTTALAISSLVSVTMVAPREPALSTVSLCVLSTPLELSAPSMLLLQAHLWPPCPWCSSLLLPPFPCCWCKRENKSLFFWVEQMCFIFLLFSFFFFVFLQHDTNSFLCSWCCSCGCDTSTSCQGHSHCLLEHILQSVLREGRTLHIHLSSNITCKPFSIFPSKWLCIARLAAGITPQISLGADNDNVRRDAVVLQLGDPLGFYILIRRRVHHRETNEKHIRVRIRKGTKTFVLFLPCRIPKINRVWLTINTHSRHMVVKHSRNIVNRKAVPKRVEKKKKKKG